MHGEFRPRWQAKPGTTGHHANAIPYSRRSKHKGRDYTEEYKQ
jgi:hypothetical protein